MLKAIDIANFYIQLANSDPEDSIDNLKINKMLYFAQGWSIARNGHKLFDEQIQAWDYGPVVRDVYDAYKKHRANPIRKPILEFDESKLSSEDLELLLDVYSFYGRYTGLELKKMTHVQGSPWNLVYKKDMNNVIPIESIGEYFKAEEPLPTFQLDESALETITKLPKEWDRPEDIVYDAI